MTKSNKKKKEKTADFTKSKLKLGKGKLQAQNATDTKFSSKSIGLPTQSISVDKSGKPVTKKNHTFDELLVQINHYSAAVKKDGLAGLKELIGAYEYLIPSTAGQIIKTCVNLLTNDDAAVRKALLIFFQWYLSILPKTIATPYASNLIYYTISGITHIFQEIRSDAIKMLDILIQAFPDILTADWNNPTTSEYGNRILQCYLSILQVNLKDSNTTAAKATSTIGTTVMTQVSQSTRISAQRSLATFLDAAMHHHQQTNQDDTTWFFRSSFETEEEYQAFIAILHPPPSSLRYQITPYSRTHEAQSWSSSLLASSQSLTNLGSINSILSELAASSASSNQQSKQSSSSTSSSDLLLSLLPTLLATFLESAPIALGPASFNAASSSNINHIEAIQSSLSIFSLLWRDVVSSPEQSEASSSVNTKLMKEVIKFVKALHPYFPFESESVIVGKDASLQNIKEEMSLAYCEAVAFLRLETSVGPASEALSVTLSGVASYISGLLDPQSSDQLAHRNLSSEHLKKLLPTIWSLFSVAEPSYSSIFLPLLHYASRVAVTSSNALLLFEFIAQVEMTHCRMQNKMRWSAEEQEALDAWLGNLPKLLWQAASKNKPLMQSILRYLQTILVRPSSETKAISSLSFATDLSKFFHFTSVKTGTISPFSLLELESGDSKLAIAVLTYAVAQQQNEQGSALLEGALRQGMAMQGSLVMA